MSEIIFRAWHTDHKCFLDEYTYPVGHTGLFINIITGKLNSIEIDYDNYADAFIKYTEIENVILTQYTGCKDKEGTKIFEGDILSTGVVVYGNGCFKVLSKRWEHDLLYSKYAYKITGNIYQNKNPLL